MTIPGALSSSPTSFGRLNVLAMVRHLIDIGAPILTFAGVPVDGASGTGTYADNPQVGTGAIIIDTENGDIYINTGTVNSVVWTLMAKGGTSLGVGQAGMIHARYDFSEVGGAQGSEIPFVTAGGNPISVPEGAIITFGILDIQTVPLSGGAATISLGVDSNAVNINAADLVTGAPWSIIGQAIVDGPDDFSTPANYVKTTAESNLTYSIGTADLTAGVFDLFLYYLQSQ